MYMYSMKNFIIKFLRVYILLCQKGPIWKDIPDPAKLRIRLDPDPQHCLSYTSRAARTFAD